MFEAVFNLSSLDLSDIPTTRRDVTNPYEVTYTKQFTFPNIAPAIHKIIPDVEQAKVELRERTMAEIRERHLRGAARANKIFYMNDVYSIPYEKLLRESNENITVSLARNRNYIFILYRGIFGKIPVENISLGKKILAFVKDAPIWDSYYIIDPIIKLELKATKNLTKVLHHLERNYLYRTYH